jgi:predicted phage tail protein
LVGLRFEASQFQAIPTRAYDIKGVKVQIPQNATVNADGSLTYSGTWDGTFKLRGVQIRRGFCVTCCYPAATD